MHLYTDTLGLSAAEFTLLRDLIHERTGLFYDDSKRDLLLNKLAARVAERGLRSFLDYYYLLKYDAAADDEWWRVLDVLSVPETYFYREMDAVRALVDVLVPEWVAAHPGETLRIWSAACASGEEPLTIAMALQEAGWFERARIAITGSDGSAAAIEAARRGVYRERSFRTLPPELRARYFSKEQDGWRIAPDLHGRVTWTTTNLFDPHAVSQLARVPFLFCRNVFIYFSPDAIRATVHRFAAQMPSPSYLLLGVSESLVRLTDRFMLQEIGEAFVYVKV
jgi:chemotaxis protein methyltransferase CheR